MTTLQPRHPPTRRAAEMSSLSCTQLSPPDTESSPGAPRAANSSSARTSRSTCSHQPEVPAATCPTASRARSSGFAESSSGVRSRTRSASVGTPSSRRWAWSRGPSMAICPNCKTGRRARSAAGACSPVRPSSNAISMLAASPVGETSSGVLSSWPSTNTRPASPVTSRSAVDEREAARRECRAHARVQHADHPQEGWLVEQSRAGGTFSAGLGQDEVGLCHYLAPGERRLQPRGAQRLWCPGLRGGPAHAVEWQEGLNQFPLGIGRLSTADFAGQLPRFRSTPSEESSIDRSPACARADETFYLQPYQTRSYTTLVHQAWLAEFPERPLRGRLPVLRCMPLCALLRGPPF